MTTTSKEKFVDLLIKNVPVDGIQVEEDIPVSPFAGGSNTNLISNSIFKDVRYPKINHNELHIKGCTFQKLNFYSGSINRLTISDSSISELIFSGDFKTQSLSISRNNRVNSIIIENGKLVTVEIIDNENVNTIQTNCSIGTLNISSKNRPQIIRNISFRGIATNLLIEHTGITDLELSQSSDNIHLKKISVHGRLSSSSVQKSKMILEDCNIQTFIAESSVAHTSVYGGEFNEMLFKNPAHTLLITKGKEEPNQDCKIATLDICEINISNFTLENTQIGQLLSNGLKAPSANFHFLIVKKLWLIEHTIMEGAKFHNVNLSDTKIRFLNSSIASSILINVEWPREFYEYETELKNKKKREQLNILWPLKESYRQVKVLSLDQHNKIDALAFQKHELKTYWKIVNLKLWSKKYFRVKDIGTWLILGTNQIFSDFGQSLGRPLLWLFVVHSFLFYLLLTDFPLGLEPSLEWDGEATWKGLGMYLNLLSPVHSTEIPFPWTDQPKPVSIFGTIDFLMRLSNAYFIYYFIRATRKFNLSL